MKDLTKWWPVLLAGLLLLVFVFALRDEAPPAAPTPVSYSEFKQLLRDGQVSQLLLAEHRAVATLKPEAEEGGGAQRVQANLPPLDDAELMPLIEASGAVVTVEAVRDGDGSWLLSLLPWLIFLGIYFWFWNRMQSNITGRFGGIEGAVEHQPRPVRAPLRMAVLARMRRHRPGGAAREVLAALVEAQIRAVLDDLTTDLEGRGATVGSALADVTDLLPTIAELTGGRLDEVVRREIGRVGHEHVDVAEKVWADRRQKVALHDGDGFVVYWPITDAETEALVGYAVAAMDLGEMMEGALADSVDEMLEWAVHDITGALDPPSPRARAPTPKSWRGSEPPVPSPSACSRARWWCAACRARSPANTSRSTRSSRSPLRMANCIPRSRNLRLSAPASRRSDSPI